MKSSCIITLIIAVVYFFCSIDPDPIHGTLAFCTDFLVS